MAKLDPDNWKSAKDVMDERQAAYLKRKREEDVESSDSPLVEPERPKKELDHVHPKAKKRKTDASDDSLSPDKHPPNHSIETEEDRIQRRKEQKAAKRELKKEKKAKKKEKVERQKARKKEAKQLQTPTKDSNVSKTKRKNDQQGQDSTKSTSLEEASDSRDEDNDDLAETIQIVEGDAFANGTSVSPAAPSDSGSEDEDEVFSPHHDSATSSISSIQLLAQDERIESQEKNHDLISTPPTEQTTNASRNELSKPATDAAPVDKEKIKERFQARMQELRSQRKATDGPKSRTELLEQRRKHEERRRAEKKEQKRREKEEATRKQEEEIAKRFSPGGSGSLLGSPRSPLIDSDSNNFSFGRVAFGDGTAFDPANPTMMGAQRKKGPSDPATALHAAKAKQSRVAGLDSEKQANIHEKDMWLNARKRAAGEKVKDDTSLLKKALKRHEGQKKKSEKEWNERKEGIRKAVDMKQKKRTENLAKRQEEKGGKGKKGKVKRPGFEGSFRGRTGGGKKKS